MNEYELVLNTLKKERKFRKEVKNRSLSSVIFQPFIFFGSKYNQALIKFAQEENEININFIDFSKIGVSEKSSGQWIEKELNAILSKPNPEFSLISFLNLNEIKGTALERSLLPFFDPHQNAQHQGLDLSNFILVATNSTFQPEKLSPPLLSRLKCVNQEEVEVPKTFLDKYFNLILGGSILLVLVSLFFIFWPWQTKKVSKV